MLAKNRCNDNFITTGVGVPGNLIMKGESVQTKLTTLLLALCLLTLTAGCRHVTQHDVKGSGKRVIQKRDVPAFTSITTEGAFDIEVVCQKDQSLQLEGDDNILDLITTEVSNGVLRLRPKSNYSIEDSIVVKITVPNLEGLSASGAGKMNVREIKNAKFDIDMSGAVSITASGETAELTIEASGAGKVDVQKLRAARATIEASGVAHIDVDVRDVLNVVINGPSKVSYSGDPEVNQTINGPGTLEKRESKGA